MKIRRYTCKDMQEALIRVKMDLGSEAVIMNSKKVKPKGFFGLFSKPMIEVVAAVDDDYVRPERKSFQQRQALKYASYPKTQLDPRPAIAQQSEESPKITAYQDRRPENIESRSPESTKLAELENKVKSMESKLDQIFKAVQKNDHIQEEKQIKTENTPPAIHNGETEIIILRNILLEKDVEPKLTEKILEKINERGGQNLKRDEILRLAERIMTVLLGTPEPILLREDKKPLVAIFIGPTGVGKTTTLAKIAADFTFRQKKVGLITADTYRIAAVEQLKTYAEILNLEVTVVYSPNEIKEAIERLQDKDLILIDTAGRSHKNSAHFNELKSLVTAANADETYLVISCNSSKAAVREILEYYAFIKSYKLLFTKLDESPAPGIILNARYMTGKPLSYTTAGQSVPDDLDIADVNQLVLSILTEYKPQNV